MSRTLLPGKPFPLGATPYKRGTNFALYSDLGTRVDVCFFDSDGAQTDCITLREKTAHVWHGFVNGIRPGQLYGFRVDGPWDPHQGLRFNFNKLLVDPYAKAICGDVDWKPEIFGYDLASGDINKMSELDSRPLRSQVRRDRPQLRLVRTTAILETPLADSIIYEVNVRGFSMRNPKVPQHLRGTYCRLGAPVQHRLPEEARHHRGGAASRPPLH